MACIAVLVRVGYLTVSAACDVLPLIKIASRAREIVSDKKGLKGEGGDEEKEEEEGKDWECDEPAFSVK